MTNHEHNPDDVRFAREMIVKPAMKACGAYWARMSAEQRDTEIRAELFMNIIGQIGTIDTAAARRTYQAARYVAGIEET